MRPVEEGERLAFRLAKYVLQAADFAGVSLVTAESCTGGYIASLLAGVEGLSHQYEGGVVVYSDQTKIALLGISPEALSRHGAVSREIVSEMAVRIRGLTAARLALAVSGNTGPRGEAENGRVHIAVADTSGVQHRYYELGDVDRDEGRWLVAIQALDILLQTLTATEPQASRSEAGVLKQDVG